MMDVVIEHLRQHATLYSTVILLSIPVIYFTRKYSVPVILYTVEASIYFVGMHTVVFAVVSLARWFKINSSMRALRADGVPADAPDWATPYFEFWVREEYIPGWIFYLEIVFCVIILALMWRYRPMKIQRESRRKHQEFKGGMKKPGAAKEFEPKRYSATRGRR